MTKLVLPASGRPSDAVSTVKVMTTSDSLTGNLLGKCEVDVC